MSERLTVWPSFNLGLAWYWRRPGGIHWKVRFRRTILIQVEEALVLLSFATADVSATFDSTKGAGFSPDVHAPIFGNRESGDVVHRRAVQLLTHGW